MGKWMNGYLEKLAVYRRLHVTVPSSAQPG